MKDESMTFPSYLVNHVVAELPFFPTVNYSVTNVYVVTACLRDTKVKSG